MKKMPNSKGVSRDLHISWISFKSRDLLLFFFFDSPLDKV